MLHALFYKTKEARNNGIHYTRLRTKSESFYRNLSFILSSFFSVTALKLDSTQYNKNTKEGMD